MTQLRDPWLTVEVRHLTALAAVARRRSFAGAAAALGYGPSAISSQIAYLEAVAGTRLFERSGTGRESTPTPAGTALLEHVEQILRTLGRARSGLDVLTASPLADVSIGHTPQLAERLGALLVPLPGAGVPDGLEPAATAPAAELLAGVARGALDAAFVELPIAQGPFSSAQLVREPRVLAAPADVPGLDARAIALRTGLVEIRDCPGSAALVRALARTGLRRHVVDTPAAALAMVRAGVAAAVLTRAEAAAAAGVRLVEDPLLPPRVIGLTWHRDRDGDPALRRLAEHARRSLAAVA